jgi:HEAT repeat protein
VRILARINGEKPLAPLVHQSLRDDSSMVRDAAVEGLRRRGPSKVIPIYVRALKNEVNLIVNRAATALGRFGDESVIPQLIDSLVTRHKYKIEVPAQEDLAMNPGRGFAQGGVPIPADVAAMLASGQLPQGVRIEYAPGSAPPVRTRTVVVQRDEQNPSVLTALGILTDEDFGFDEKAWRRWHTAQQNGTAKKKAKKP